MAGAHALAVEGDGAGARVHQLGARVAAVPGHAWCAVGGFALDDDVATAAVKLDVVGVAAAVVVLVGPQLHAAGHVVTPSSLAAGRIGIARGQTVGVDGGAPSQRDAAAAGGLGGGAVGGVEDHALTDRDEAVAVAVGIGPERDVAVVGGQTRIGADHRVACGLDQDGGAGRSGGQVARDPVIATVGGDRAIDRETGVDRQV